MLNGYGKKRDDQQKNWKFHFKMNQSFEFRGLHTWNVSFFMQILIKIIWSDFLKQK